MKIISFAYTTPALLARAKSVTRREWKDNYGKRFRAGEKLQAYDRSPRSGGRRVGTIQLSERPYREQISQMPDEDFQKEGFAWLEQHSKAGYFLQNGRYTNMREYFDVQRTYGDVTLWVVRFRIVELFHEQQLQLFT